MASLIGLHMRGNGIKQIPSRAVLSLNGVGLGGDETHADTITVLRDTRVFPDGEAPPDFNSYDGSDWVEYGEYWYTKHKEKWILNPAHYFQITNEQGGGEGPDVAANLQRLIDVESSIMQAANADGRKICLLNLAGGSPGDFELWKELIAPFLVRAWDYGGNIYGRHCYADKFVNDDGSIVPGQPQRVIDELEYLKSIGYGGGVVLTECGLFGGYGVASYDYFEQQVTRWEQALRPYADIFIGLAWWETGASEFNADYTNHLKKLLPYIEAGDLPQWAPPITEPPDNGQGGSMTTIKRDIRARIDNIRPLNNGVLENKKLVIRQRYIDENGKEAWSVTPTEIELHEATTYLVLDVPIREVVEDEPTNPNPPPVVSNPLPQGALVVDVSYSNDVNLATLKANGVQGVIIRASNGIRTTSSSDANGIDIRFWQHLEEAAALGMPWGSYHYCNENYGDMAQVAHFCGIIQLALDEGYPPPSLGLWLDFETPDDPIYAGAPTSEVRIQALCTALAEQRPSGVDFGVYSSPGWWNGKVPNALTWVPPLGMRQWLAAWVPESKLTDGLYPPSGWNPGNLLGFSGRHRWQFTPAGGYTVGHTIKALDLNYEGAAVPSKPPTPPAETYDILAYMQGTHKQQHTLQYTWSGGGTQTIQIMQTGNEWKYVKGGGQYEQLYFDANWIYRAEDTSESADRFYTHSTNGTLGAAWVKRNMAVGEAVYTTKQVQHYLKAGCVPQNSGLVTDKLTLTAVYPTYTFDSGIVLPNVIRLEWAAGEGYLFAKGYGLVGFEFSGGKSYISELALQGRADLPISVPGCIDLSGRFYA